MQKISNKEFYEKYKDVKVKFKEYYKMTFEFEGTLEDGKRIEISTSQRWDGDSYRLYVSANEPCKIWGFEI